MIPPTQSEINFGIQSVHATAIAAPTDIADQKLRDLLALWHELRADAAVPDPSTIDPFLLRPWLGALSIVEILGGSEVPAERRFRFRLFGTEWFGLFGRDLTGTYVDDNEPQTANSIHRAYDDTIGACRPHRLTAMVGINATGYPVGVEALLLPFGSAPDAITRLVIGARFQSTRDEN